MKYFLIFILGFFCTFNLHPRQVTIDIYFVSEAIDNKVMRFGDMLTYRQTEGTATWSDSDGDYGLLKCMGNYLTTKSDGTILNNYCQGTNRNKDTNTNKDKNKDKEYSPKEAFVLEWDCLHISTCYQHRQ